MSFKKTYKTTEFLWTAIMLILLIGSQFKKENLNSWAIAAASVASSYCVGRGIFKKNRSDAIGIGERTTEFSICLVASLMIFYRTYSGNIDFGVGIISASAICSAYNLSRGHAKSKTPSQSKVNIF